MTVRTTVLLSRAQLRRRSIPRFIEAMASVHPELRDVVCFDDFVRIAHREHVTVRVVDLPPQQKGRTIRFAGRVFIQINRSMSRAEQTMTGMHEMCHVWRDDPGVAAYYSDAVTGGACCEFADIFAWFVTSAARPLYDQNAQQLELPIQR